KTGSTFLQRVFYDNRGELRTRGLLYPEANIRGFGHHDIAFLIAGGYPEWATKQDKPLSTLTADLAAEIAAHRGSLLFSSENFYLFPAPGALKDLLENSGALSGRTARIVVYIRRQDDAHESWYNQRVKAQGETGTIEESLESFHDLWDYQRQLALWAQVFGEDALIVKRYPPASGDAPLLDGILDTLGLADFVPRLPQKSVNVRENRDILSFQRELNRLPLTPQEKRRFHRELMTLSERAKGRGMFDERPLLGRDEREAIMARYAAGNAAVAKRYFGGDPLFPAQPERAREAAGLAPRVEAGLTDKKMVYILGWLLAYKD
ncbi:MAG TPA: hypothetical protein VHD14_17510, partial [Pseudolabrys sp.]|nr:hypothetical protein [Pseudolabrys sp.]